MNPRVFLRFLRPLRSLAVIGCYTFLAGLEGPLLFQLDPGTSRFIALAVALPLLLGIFIAGAVHEPMHRPFALLLPGLRRRQRTAASVSVLIAALAATCAATWAAPAVSPLATFGLVCALVALPCLARHHRLLGQVGGFTGFLIWLGTGVIAGPKLASAMNAAPSLFLLAGLVISTASLMQGFSRESLRIRAHTLFMAYQTHFCSYLFHRGMVAGWQAEVLAQRNRQGKAPVAAGRDWTVRSVGATSLDWMRVFWHAKFGARRGNSFLRVQLAFSAMTLIYAAVLPALMVFLDHKEYWPALARLAASDPKITDAGLKPLAMMLQPGMAMLFAMQFAPALQLTYPLSRERMARVVFWQSLVQWTTALVFPATMILLASVIGQMRSGQFLPGYGLPALLAVDLSLAVLLPLLVAVGTVRRVGLRILALVPIGMAILLAAFSHPQWSEQALTLPGILLVLAATSAAQWLLWHRLHRDYATADLTSDTGLTQLIRLNR